MIKDKTDKFSELRRPHFIDGKGQVLGNTNEVSPPVHLGNSAVKRKKDIL